MQQWWWCAYALANLKFYHGWPPMRQNGRRKPTIQSAILLKHGLASKAGVGINIPSSQQGRRTRAMQRKMEQIQEKLMLAMSATTCQSNNITPSEHHYYPVKHRCLLESRKCEP